MTQAAMPYVLELVVFKIKEGTEEARFLESAQTLTEFLRTAVPGFQSRNLMHTADHEQWTDMIYWSNMEMALGAMKQLHSAAAFQNFASMINSQDMKMLHLIAAEPACDQASGKEDTAHA